MLNITLGLMKAGKSKSLIKKHKVYVTSKFESVGVFAYKPNTKQLVVEVSTREKGLEPIACLNLSVVSDKVVKELVKQFDVVFIDEVQFAPKSHIDAIVEESFLKVVNCYGLYLDYLSEEFETISYLREKATEELGLFYKEKFLSADCDICDNVAEHNIRVTDETDLFVTEKDIYKTVCSMCKKEIEG